MRYPREEWEEEDYCTPNPVPRSLGAIVGSPMKTSHCLGRGLAPAKRFCIRVPADVPMQGGLAGVTTS